MSEHETMVQDCEARESKLKPQPMILMYREGAKLGSSELAALREAGIVPIKVAKFEDVRLVDPMATADRATVWMAAIEAIRDHKPGTSGPKTLFGEKLAAMLANTAPVKRHE